MQSCHGGRKALEEQKEGHTDQNSGDGLEREAGGLGWADTMQSRISSWGNTTTSPTLCRVDWGHVNSGQPFGKLWL